MSPIPNGLCPVPFPDAVQGLRQQGPPPLVSGGEIKEGQLGIRPGKFREPHPKVPQPDPPGAPLDKQSCQRGVEVMILGRWPGQCHPSHCLHMIGVPDQQPGPPGDEPLLPHAEGAGGHQSVKVPQEPCIIRLFLGKDDLFSDHGAAG